MVQIIPAVLSKTEEQYGNDIERLSKCEGLKNGWVHIDFADNDFVPNQTIQPDIVSNYSSNLKKEAHLMVSHPKDWIDKLINAGFERIIFHIEAKDETDEVIDYIKSKGLEVGIAIKMDTPVEKLQPFVDKIDILLVMSIVPGFQGQPFIPESLDRIRDIRLKNWPIQITVDGSVKDENAKAIIEAGADYLIVGSYLLKGDIDENLEKLWEALRQAQGKQNG